LRWEVALLRAKQDGRHERRLALLNEVNGVTLLPGTDTSPVLPDSERDWNTFA